MNTIYGITNKKSGKIVYVGCTGDVPHRLAVHRHRSIAESDPHYNQPLYQSIRKYGLSRFSVVEIARVKNRVQALKLEAAKIKELQPQFNKHHKKVK